MENIEIRNLIKKYRLKNYEVANKLGLHEATLSRWLRFPLDDEKKEKVIAAIESLKEF